MGCQQAGATPVTEILFFFFGRRAAHSVRWQVVMAQYHLGTLQHSREASGEKLKALHATNDESGIRQVWPGHHS